MTAQLWAVVIAAFLASAVECVEALTIVLVVGVTINWRSAFVGAAAAVLVLAVIVGVFGTAIVRYVPLDALRVIVGFLLVLFGLKWLKKALLRFAGLKATHDEEAVYEEQLAQMRAHGKVVPTRIDPFGVATSFKSVLLEGMEVAFIVISFGAQGTSAAHEGDGIAAAAIGAAAALVVVAATGALVQAPLQRVPENTLKFIVGLMLTTFGTFWGGEGIGIAWPGEDLFLLALLAFYVVVAWLLILWLRTYAEPQRAPASIGQPAGQEVLG